MISSILIKTGVKKEEVTAIVETFFDVAKESLLRDEEVYIKDFGRFFNKRTKERKGRNITKGTTVIIPARSTPAFRATGEFDKLIKKGK